MSFESLSVGVVSLISAVPGRLFIVENLPWVLSSITIWMTILTGEKNKYTWALGLFGQVLWSVWILLGMTWGLVPLNLTLWVLYYRNHLKWTQDARHERARLQYVDILPLRIDRGVKSKGLITL